MAIRPNQKNTGGVRIKSTNRPKLGNGGKAGK